MVLRRERDGRVIYDFVALRVQILGACALLLGLVVWLAGESTPGLIAFGGPGLVFCGLRSRLVLDLKTRYLTMGMVWSVAPALPAIPCRAVRAAGLSDLAGVSVVRVVHRTPDGANRFPLWHVNLVIRPDGRFAQALGGTSPFELVAFPGPEPAQELASRFAAELKLPVLEAG